MTGACYYLLENYDNAQDAFQKILDNPQSSTKDEASWYLALTYLKQNQKAAAKTLLENIVGKQSWNHVQATEILGKL